MGARRYEYRPGLLDLHDPTVIRGKPIKPGAIVTIVKAVGDPLNWFVYVVDEAGNEQSVFRRALTPA